MKDELDRDAETKRKNKQGVLLFVIFGAFIVAAIALMFFIDYYYAADSSAGQQRPHDAVDQ